MTDSVAPNFTENEVKNILNMKEKLKELINQHGIFESMVMSKEGEISSINNSSAHEHLVIAGGVFTSLFHKEPIKDIDVFILRMPEHDTPYINLFESLMRLKEGTWNVKYRFNEEDDYYNPHVFGVADHVETNVQYIMTDHLTRQELIKDFDFLHSTVSYHDDKLHINRETYDAIANKKLIRQNRKKDPHKGRIEKFLRKGFAVTGEPPESKTSLLLKQWEEAKNNIKNNLFVPAPPTLLPADAWFNSQVDSFLHGRGPGPVLNDPHGPNTFKITMDKSTKVV